MLVKAFFMSVIRSQDVPRGAPSALALARLPRRRRERRRAIRARGGGRAGDRGADGKAGRERGSVSASMPEYTQMRVRMRRPQARRARVGW